MPSFKVLVLAVLGLVALGVTVVALALHGPRQVVVEKPRPGDLLDHLSAAA